MLKMSVRNGQIRNLTIGKKVKVMTATNSLGYEVQQYSHDSGWTKVPELPIVKTPGLAELMLQEHAQKFLEQSKDFNDQPHLRVYEALVFPVQ